jgi:hypothetical protein
MLEAAHAHAARGPALTGAPCFRMCSIVCCTAINLAFAHFVLGQRTSGMRVRFIALEGYPFAKIGGVIFRRLPITVLRS